MNFFVLILFIILLSGIYSIANTLKEILKEIKRFNEKTEDGSIEITWRDGSKSKMKP